MVLGIAGPEIGTGMRRCFAQLILRRRVGVLGLNFLGFLDLFLVVKSCGLLGPDVDLAKVGDSIGVAK